MKKSQFSEAKIVEILALPSQGQSIDEICLSLPRFMSQFRLEFKPPVGIRLVS